MLADSADFGRGGGGGEGGIYAKDSYIASQLCVKRRRGREQRGRWCGEEEQEQEPVAEDEKMVTKQEEEEEKEDLMTCRELELRQRDRQADGQVNRGRWTDEQVGKQAEAELRQGRRMERY